MLIVGAGPAGLTTAITLAHHGVASLLVERRSELSGLPRATGASTRTMELVRSWGIEADVRAGEIEAEWLCAAARPSPRSTAASASRSATRRSSSAR